jgi:hypothetical protein
VAVRCQLPGGRRLRRDRGPRPAAAAAGKRPRPRRVGGGPAAAAARPGARGAGGTGRVVLGRARQRRALPPQQADRRWLSGRRQQAAGAARARRRRRRRRQARGAADDGLHRRPHGAQPRALSAVDGGRRGLAARPRPAVSVLSRPLARAAARGVRDPARRDRGLDRRMEVRRHPGPGGEAGVAGLDLVARRGAGDRALPGARRRRGGPAERQRARRRDRRLEGRAGRAPSPCCSSASAARR